MRGKPLDTKMVDLPKSTRFDCHITGQYEVIVGSRAVGWVRKNRYPHGWRHNVSPGVLFESRRAAAADLIERQAK